MTHAVDCKEEIADLLARYVTLLDERQFDEWLELFTESSYYTLILHEDYVKGNNMVAIGEDKPRLAGRIEVGRNVERDRTTHLLTATMGGDDGGEITASSNFAVVRKGAIFAWGRYYLTLARSTAGLKIERCTAVLNNDVIAGTIYLPV
jgi:3-phenylpropionate/cinnamic acid dioxygenase small subunit